jgi:hypothetical protein
MWAYLIIVAGCFLLLRFRRGIYQERAASGLKTTPLYLTTTGLTVLLGGGTMYVASLGEDAPLSWWLAVGAMAIAILVMRRVLQWRYPYR